MRRPTLAGTDLLLLSAAIVLLAPACSPPEKALPPCSQGLLVALARFEVSPEGKILPRPRDACLEVLLPRDGMWEVVPIEDPESNVFHKAMVYDPGPERGGPGILTLGGTGAAVKLWRKEEARFRAETLWRADFGGEFSRMRDAEAADLFGDGQPVLAVATHDQGVVALLAPGPPGEWTVEELDRRPGTIVHEIEIGDLDGDGVLEVYATPSEPNLLDGRPQPGTVVGYVPARHEGPTVVADLGDRHAKEILVTDMDGDGLDELYASVEAVSGGRLAILRFDAGTDPAKGTLVARLDDQLCRFLTAGDVDGDGRREMVAAAYKSGLWLLRPPESGSGSWSVESIDRRSSGFEHAALLADLDEDGRDELYVASDDQGEIRRYRWRDGKFTYDVIRKREVPGSAFTWNLATAPRSLLE